MVEFCRSFGLSLAPHGKITMNQRLFARQLQTGAWAITLATPVPSCLTKGRVIAGLNIASTIAGWRLQRQTPFTMAAPSPLTRR